MEEAADSDAAGSGRSTGCLRIAIFAVQSGLSTICSGV
jgi:hypothetical protein